MSTLRPLHVVLMGSAGSTSQTLSPVTGTATSATAACRGGRAMWADGEHASKTDVRLIDFVDTGHPALLRMWDKRQRGYRAMGYRVAAKALSDDGATSASAGGSSTYQP